MDMNRLMGIQPNTTTQDVKVHISANSAGVFICTLCCALVVGISIGGTAIILRQGQEISDARHERAELRKEISGLNDYLSVIYQQLPSLKKMEKNDEQDTAD
jgi:hypothetical protein